MEPRTAATRVPDPDAAEFVRYCYRRRRVGWPELYDEMCAVASRGLYKGYGADDLSAMGIGFGLFDMPALAALARQIVAEEQALRRPMTVTIVAAPEPEVPVEVVAAANVADVSARQVVADVFARQIVADVSAHEVAADVAAHEVAADVSAHQVAAAAPAPTIDDTPVALPAVRFAPVPA